MPLFQKAYAVYPLGLGSLRNVAVCEEALNHFARLPLAWLDLKRAVSGSNDTKYAGWNDDADRAMAHLASKVAVLIVDLAAVEPPGQAGPAAPPSESVNVTVDGDDLPRDRLGAATEHDPGMVTVRASGPGVVTPDEQSVTLVAGDTKRVTLHVTVAAPAASLTPVGESAAPNVESAGSAPPSPTSPARAGAWIALGIGAAGLVGTAISYAVRQSALGDLNASCPAHASAPCDPSTQDTVMSEVSRGRTASTLVTVFGAVGIAGVAASVALFAVSRSSSGQTAIVLTPSGVGAAGTF